MGIVDEVNDSQEYSSHHQIRQVGMIVGSIFMIIGFPVSVNLLCAISGVYAGEMIYSIFSCLAVWLTLGVGLAIFVHSNQSIQNKPSKRLSLPSILPMMGAFGLLFLLGFFFFNVMSSGIFFPPVLILLAILPPLWSVAWFMGSYLSMDLEAKKWTRTDPSTDGMLEKGEEGNGITWRRGMLAFISGATIAVLIALILEIILPTIILVLVADLSSIVANSARGMINALASYDIARAVTTPGFIYVFIQIAIIAPLAEEFAKPLAILPLLHGLNRRQAFLLGALAGAGFAAVENVIYAASGQELWAGILLVRSLGGALHPLCAGLMALAWRDALYEQSGTWSKWLTRFALAVGIHALWNGGSLLVLTVGSAGLFGKFPIAIDILGLSAAGTVLAFLIVLGIAALWGGRILGHGDAARFSISQQEDAPPSEQTLAIWAIACLMAIVPIGIVGLSLWLR